MQVSIVMYSRQLRNDFVLEGRSLRAGKGLTFSLSDASIFLTERELFRRFFKTSLYKIPQPLQEYYFNPCIVYVFCVCTIL